MSGLATREVLQCQLEVFGDGRFERLATASNAHIPSSSTASTPTTAGSTSTTASRPCSTSCASSGSPSPAPEPPATTRWSRARNAHVVRRCLGHDHIPKRFADDVNQFAQGVLSPFLNFHRPCLFATECRDPAGKTRGRYLPGDAMNALRPVPVARRRALPQAWRQPRHPRRLRPGRDRPRGGARRPGRTAQAVPAHLRRDGACAGRRLTLSLDPPPTTLNHIQGHRQGRLQN